MPERIAVFGENGVRVPQMMADGILIGEN